MIDYKKEDFSGPGGQSDVVFEAVGKASFAACLRALKNRGTILHVVAPPGVQARMGWNKLTMDKKLIGGKTIPQSGDLVFLKELCEAGKLTPVIDRTYPFEQIVDAHSYVDTGRKKGNVVIAL